MKLQREFALFAVGGLLGLLIDAGTVQVLVGAAGWNPYGARVPSFLLAASATWWWNRRHTFAHRRSGRPAWAEWLHWLALMGMGAAVNYGVYALLLAVCEPLRRWPALGVAAGSVAGALVNFSAARGLLFSRPRPASQVADS